MDDVAFVDVIQRDAYHCENTNNILFRQKFLFALDNILQTLIAFFHDNARKIVLIFDDVDDFTYHGVFERPEPINFAFGFSQ